MDQSNLDGGASYVNAGYISPSHFVPLSAPGVVKKGLQWMFDPSSPFYVKPRMETEFLRWAWAFNKSCNPRHVQRSAPVIRDISLLSRDLYDEMHGMEGFDFHYEKKGLLMLCQTEKMLDKEIQLAREAATIGLQAETIDREGLKKLEPEVLIDAVGATLYPCDYHTTPGELMENMKAWLLANGVQFHTGEEVIDLTLQKDRIASVRTNKGILEADEFVLAAGSWTSLLSRKIGLRILLQAGKGYRINTFRPTGIRYPAILVEAKAAVTPMNGFTRFAGTMEIAGISTEVNKVRVEAIARAANRYYPDVQLSEEERAAASSGMRPLSPDGLPYIGRSEKCTNLTIATGHAMMGWTMATGTGQLVNEIVSGKPPSMDIAPFHPDRKF